MNSPGETLGDCPAGSFDLIIVRPSVDHNDEKDNVDKGAATDDTAEDNLKVTPGVFGAINTHQHFVTKIGVFDRNGRHHGEIRTDASGSDVINDKV